MPDDDERDPGRDDKHGDDGDDAKPAKASGRRRRRGEREEDDGADRGEHRCLWMEQRGRAGRNAGGDDPAPASPSVGMQLEQHRDERDQEPRSARDPASSHEPLVRAGADREEGRSRDAHDAAPEHLATDEVHDRNRRNADERRHPAQDVDPIHAERLEQRDEVEAARWVRERDAEIVVARRRRRHPAVRRQVARHREKEAAVVERERCSDDRRKAQNGARADCGEEQRVQQASNLSMRPASDAASDGKSIHLTQPADGDGSSTGIGGQAIGARRYPNVSALN